MKKRKYAIPELEISIINSGTSLATDLSGLTEVDPDTPIEGETYESLFGGN